jgi:hypothetical protein
LLPLLLLLLLLLLLPALALLLLYLVKSSSGHRRYAVENAIGSGGEAKERDGRRVSFLVD